MSPEILRAGIGFRKYRRNIVKFVNGKQLFFASVFGRIHLYVFAELKKEGAIVSLVRCKWTPATQPESSD